MEGKRKIQCCKDAPHDPLCYFTSVKNPCGCGSRYYHFEDDGKNVIGVCNFCGMDIYRVRPEYTEEYRSNGVWSDTAEEAGERMPDEKAAALIIELVSGPENRFSQEQEQALKAAVQALKRKPQKRKDRKR